MKRAHSIDAALLTAGKPSMCLATPVFGWATSLLSIFAFAARRRRGWMTYSPPITLDFAHHPDVSWRR